MADAWQQVPPPPWATAGPPQQSGLLKACTILLLVGAILAVVGAFLMLVFTALFGFVLAAFQDEGRGDMGFPAVIGIFYGAFGLLLLASAVCGFIGWRKAGQGDLQGAFVWGLVASLLPPVNILLLLGAIFAKTCPEAEAAVARQRQAWSPPPQAR
jgi:hypothetical protein